MLIKTAKYSVLRVVKIISLDDELRIVKIIHSERKMVVSRNWGKRNGDLSFNECLISASQDQNSPGDGWCWWFETKAFLWIYITEHKLG